MANLVHDYGIGAFLAAQVNGGASATPLKLMLLLPSYVQNQAHQYVSSLTAYELVAAGYVGGYGGAGRKGLTGQGVTVDTVNHRAYITGTGTWPIGLGTNETIAMCALIVEAGGSDATSLIVATFDAATQLFGGSLVLAASATGLVRGDG